MQYAIITKGEHGSVASLQPSRDEAAEFWSELQGDATRAKLEENGALSKSELGEMSDYGSLASDIEHTLRLMGDREREQEGDSHSTKVRRVYTLEVPGGGYPQMMWAEDLGEAGLEFVSVEEHRALALQKDAEPA